MNTSSQTEQTEQMEQTSHASQIRYSTSAPSGTVITLEAFLYEGYKLQAGWHLCSLCSHRTHQHTGDTWRKQPTGDKKKYRSF